MTVSAPTVRAALESVFSAYPRLRSYIFNDQGELHRHMAIIVNGTATTDRQRLDQPVSDSDEIYVMQALSGG